jgi:hypothetical protein
MRPPPALQAPAQQQGDAEHGAAHRISAPSFDGRLYSVC